MRVNLTFKNISIKEARQLCAAAKHYKIVQSIDDIDMEKVK